MNGNSKPPAYLPWWFIGIMVAPLAIGGWYVSGQPGRALQDGDYGCSEVVTISIPVLGGDAPGATVEGGKVVDVWDFNIRKGKGKKRSLEWSDAERRSPNEFSVDSVGTLSGDPKSFICTQD